MEIPVDLETREVQGLSAHLVLRDNLETKENPARKENLADLPSARHRFLGKSVKRANLDHPEFLEKMVRQAEMGNREILERKDHQEAKDPKDRPGHLEIPEQQVSLEPPENVEFARNIALWTEECSSKTELDDKWTRGHRQRRASFIDHNNKISHQQLGAVAISDSNVHQFLQQKYVFAEKNSGQLFCNIPILKLENLFHILLPYFMYLSNFILLPISLNCKNEQIVIF